jgi:crotonobetainyl-CoA hydratase
MELVEVTRQGRVATVELQRPEARNAVNREMTAELNVTFDALEADDTVWAVVITGAGDKAFCAGADLKAIEKGELRTRRPRPETGFAGIAGRGFRKPLIAALNGDALGGGFEIVLACDLVVAEQHVVLGLPEVTRGFVAAAGGIARLSRRIPLSVALEIAMTGDPISAQRGFDLGIVNRVVPSGSARQEGVALAEKVSGNAPVAVRLTKQVLRAAVSLNESELFALQAQGARTMMAGEDALEGPRAFNEKRAPIWKGN